MDARSLAARVEYLQVVDVRGDPEWAAGRIEGSVHVPLGELEDRLDELDRGARVVTVCRTGSRSSEAAGFLVGLGFRAENLEGGLAAWELEGLPLSTPDGRPGTVLPDTDETPEVERSEEQEVASSAVDGPGLQAAFMDVVAAVQARFGDDASEEQIRSFLKDRLLAEGKTEEEAEEILGPPEDA